MGKKKPEDTPLDPLLASRIEEIMAKADNQLDPDEKERVRIALKALAPIADKAGDIISDLRDLLSGETDSDDTNGDEGNDAKATPPKGATPAKGAKAPAKPVPTAKSAKDKKSEEINMEKSDVDISAHLGEISDEGLRTAVEQMLKKSAEDNKEKEEALAKAAKLEDERKTEQFMKKASEFTNLPGVDGELLKALSEKAPDEYPKLEELLRATNANMAKSATFKEIGRETYEPDSAEAKADALAAEIMAKSDKINKTAAKAKAWDPTLYERYLKESRKA